MDGRGWPWPVEEGSLVADNFSFCVIFDRV